MARTKASGRTNAPASGRSPSRAAPLPPKVRVPSEEDLELARSDALLQLRIGRSAHYYSILVAMALLFDAALVLYIQPNITSVEPAQIRSVFFLLFPLIGGIFLALFGLRVKWETYQLWPWEAHFSMSLAAVAYNGVLVYIFFASLLHFGPTGHWSLLPWFYPGVLGGLSLALLGLSLTWSEWTQRKTVSLVAALLPVPFAAVVYGFGLTASSIVDALALSLSTAAVLYLISGGFLHIISSGTRTHEREVITSGQSRLFQVAEEVRQKEEAFRFREGTLLKREADAEDLEASLSRQHQALDEARAQLAQQETELGQRLADLRTAEESWATRSAEANALQQAAKDRESALALREKDLAGQSPRLAERERTVTQREGEQRQREVELGRREQELQRRLSGIPESEAALERRRQEVDRRTAELLQRESTLRTREAAAGNAAASTAGATPGGLEEREAHLAQLKMTLDEQNLALGRRARQIDEMLKDVLRREEGLGRRESDLTGREGALTQRETDAKGQFDLGESRRQQYEGAMQQYADRLKQVDVKEATVNARRLEIERQGTLAQQREAQLKERDQQLAVQRTSLDRLQRVLAERQKSLEAREDELALRRQQTGGVAAPTAELAEAEPLARPVATRFKDREPTGTPRLDDLLQGGLGAKSHLLLLGDAFVGKEVVLYAFLAEGLKRGEPAVIVTTSRSPEEVGQQIGLVAPQFREYEQMGKVAWVDATASTQTGTSSRKISGPDDHAGILSAVVAACKRFDGAGAKAVRVGYLGLTSTLAHADDRAATVFVQNFVGILKPRAALAMYTVEAGALPEARVEGILSRMDGAIRFRQERDKTFLQVAGLGEVETREWVECRATNRALVIGSFTLERIR